MASTAGVPRFGARHQQCILLFCSQFVMYSLLMNVPLAIVAMTDDRNAHPTIKVFDWDEQIRSTILSSFFWGYITSQVGFAALVTRYGSKIVLLTGVGVNSLLNLAIPPLTFWAGSSGLLAVRITQGIFQGALFPSTHNLIANWAPVSERSRLSIFIYPGAQIGTVVALTTGGYVASSRLGWPGIFYIWGVVGLLWCVMWCFFGAESPSVHKHISAVERDYILGSRTEHTRQIPTPWKRVLRSRPFYSLIITHTCSAYCFWTIATITPSYMKGVFGVDIQQNALLSALPPIAMFAMSHIFGAIGRYCMDHWKLSLREIRILFNSIGLLIPGFILFALRFVPEGQALMAILLLTTAAGFSSAVFLGYYVNHIDLCPTHAGVLMGITNSVASSGGIFATLAIGWWVTDETNPSQWQNIFNVGTGLLTFGTFVFAVFGRFENQHWNVPTDGDLPAARHKDSSQLSIKSRF